MIRSYRAQDFVEVHEADGHRHRLQQDRRQGDEPQTLEGHRHGHVTSSQQRVPSSAKTHDTHFQQGRVWDKSDQAPLRFRGTEEAEQLG